MCIRKLSFHITKYFSNKTVPVKPAFTGSSTETMRVPINNFMYTFKEEINRSVTLGK